MRLPRNGENRSGGEHPRGHDRPRTNGTNGAHPAGLRTRPISLPNPEPDFADEAPIDLVALQADDELINALAAGLTVAAADGGHQDDQMTAILAAWKAEIDAEPMPALVDLDTAVTTVQAARRPSGRSRHLVPVAAAAAGLVILLGGVSLGSYSAEPDDTLWPVTKVLYSERAESVEAAGRVEARIARAERAIAEGQPALAKEVLRAAAADLAVVRPEDGLVQLGEVQSFLQAKAEETLPAARTSTQKSPAGGPSSNEPGPSGATSPDSAPPPAAPDRIDPRVLGDVPPAPAERPEVSTAPEVDAPPPAKGPGGGESSGGLTPVEPAPPVEQVPGADGAAPAPAPEGVQSIGATAADTSTTTPSPTS
ncbi:MAG TPA: anti-sigma-D factor RsdA [Pseudonocardia sp.]|nr:anti-sigma-D factor RsdA [Pseudonocardia sp.]